MNVKWLILSYRAQAEPSTIRVRVWRTLKSAGALYIQQSVCVLPDAEETSRKISQLRDLILGNGGEALLLSVEMFTDDTEKELIAMFNEQRETEYKDFFRGCDAFIQEIERETQSSRFTFHEVEENEVELIRLKKWHRKIVRRDFFRSKSRSPSTQKLSECETLLHRFTERVYASEGREGDLS